MASQQRGGNFIDPATERPRSLNSTWFEMARSVYSWTDRREAAVDKAWWRKQAPGFHVQEPGEASTGEIAGQPLNGPAPSHASSSLGGHNGI